MDSTRTLTLITLLAAPLLLAGCASPEAPAGPAEVPAPAASAEAPASASADALLSLAHITSCDQVAAVVQPYIGGLVQKNDDVGEWGVSCGWEAADDETDMANNRSVSVSLVSVQAGTEPPVTSGIVAMDGGAQHDDPWLAENGGVAYSLTLGTDVAASIASTVWLPGVEAQIGGGTWGDVPALDGPAAVAVVKQLLG